MSDIVPREVEELVGARTEEAAGAWFVGYMGSSYRRAVERGLERLSNDRAVILKTDLWNECLGAPRNVLGRLAATSQHRLLAVELSHQRCVEARRLVPQVGSVAGSITALPFRSDSVDLLLDLSTIDHVPEAAVSAAIDEYTRVLHRGGVLVLVSWQSSAPIKLRLWLKRRLGIPENPGQHYHARGALRSLCADRLTVTEEFAAGTLLVLPMRALGPALTALPRRVVTTLLDRLVRLEHGSSSVLRQVAGLYGLVAVKDGHRTGRL